MDANRETAVKHKHIPKPFLRDAVGTYSKRGDRRDLVWFRGRVDRCDCGTGWFVPDDSNLTPIELDEKVPLPE